MVVIHLNTDMQTQADMKTGQLNGRMPKKQWANVSQPGIYKCSIHQNSAVSSVSSTGQFRRQTLLITLTRRIVRETGEYINPLRHIVLIICCDAKHCNLKEDNSRIVRSGISGQLPAFRNVEKRKELVSSKMLMIEYTSVLHSRG